MFKNFKKKLNIKLINIFKVLKAQVKTIESFREQD